MLAILLLSIVPMPDVVIDTVDAEGADDIGV